MKTKLQYFSNNLIQTLLSLVKLLLWTNWRNDLEKDSEKEKQRDVYILGNGPSLKNLLVSQVEFLSSVDTICVNHFPLSESFEQLKPTYYLVNAPEFWLTNVQNSYISSREKLFSALISKTDWDLVILIPELSKRHLDLKKVFAKNQHIRLQFYNSTPLEGFDGFVFRAFSKKMGMPRPHNVLIPCLMVSSWLGYKNIFLLGADHNWLGNLTVTKENEVLIDRKHFYQERDKSEPMYLLGKRKRELFEVLYKYMNMFKSYSKVRDYMNWKKTFRIYNATPESFIDAFERIEILNE